MSTLELDFAFVRIMLVRRRMMTAAARILIVDDDENLQNLLAFCLQKEGYAVANAGSAEDAHKQLAKKFFDLAVLDLGLPDEDGLVLLRQLRTRSAMPIVVLTGATKQDALLAALELGADDFIGKPFDPQEVLLRIKAVLSRTLKSRTADNSSNPTMLHFNGWTLDLNGRSLTSSDQTEVSLTPGEFHILSTLAMRPGWAFSRDQLLDAIAKGEETPSPRMIDVFVAQLRSKIEANTRKPELIVSVRGYGYKFSSAAKKGVGAA